MTLRGWGAPVLVAGPCAIEGNDTDLAIGEALADLGQRLGVSAVFKGSYDKANRSGASAERGIGLEEGLAALDRVRTETDLPILTDVHETAQVRSVAQVVDAIQVPAFLCRQTDLLVAVGASGKPVNVKKGQWMAPEAMKGAADKVRSATGNGEIAITERGSFFGYGDLIVDMRSFRKMRDVTGCIVLYDATHSVQRPGSGPNGGSGGSPDDVAPLLFAAASAGADGFFIETHPDPMSAVSDRETMLPLAKLEPLMERAIALWHMVREGVHARA